MDGDKHPRTTRDALILEALGDLGELLTKADQLNSTIAPLVAALHAAQMGTMAAVERHADNQKQQIQALAEQERVALAKALQTAVTNASNGLEKAGKQMARELQRPPGLPAWKQAAICLAIALVAGWVAIGGTYWLVGRDLDNQAALGRAVMAVWGQLDSKTQAQIERAF